jgi:DNA-directed RNA polymerase specialized sigma24 family protein
VAADEDCKRTKERFLMSPTAPLSNPLASPTVRADILAVLRRRGIGPDDILDLVQETLARALAVRNPPRDLPECTRLTRVIARNVAATHVYRRALLRRHDSGAAPDDTPAPDDGFATTRDPIDRDRQLALMVREVTRGRLSPRAVAIVHAVSEDVPQTAIAEELGIGHGTVRNELCRARRSFQARWSALERDERPNESHHRSSCVPSSTTCLCGIEK